MNGRQLVSWWGTGPIIQIHIYFSFLQISFFRNYAIPQLPRHQGI